MDKRLFRWLIVLFLLGGAMRAQTVVAFYDTKGEPDHVDFAKQGIAFFEQAAAKHHLTFRATTDWNELNAAALKEVRLVIWLNGEPSTAAQRAAFETYMEHGGGWLGCHVSAYNDKGFGWPWFPRFLGGAVFEGNNWPPLPAELVVEETKHPVTQGLPKTFFSPANEWYSWSPNPRSDPKVKVLVTLSPRSMPIGLKDRIVSGDVPVVWTNTRYRMLYVNMGHGAHVFDSEVQNRLWENALVWLTR